MLAIDGTKVHANASQHATHSYEEIAREILAEADAVDAAEDEQLGDRRGDELPPELATAQGRRGWLREAKRRLDEQRAEAARPIPRSRPDRLKEATRRLEEEHEVECRANADYEAYVLASDRGGELYAKRQGMIEPVFAHTKFNRRMDRFQRRGRSAARSEWRLMTATHNLLKLYKHTTATLAACRGRHPAASPAQTDVPAETPHSTRFLGNALATALYATATQAKAGAAHAVGCTSAGRPERALSAPPRRRLPFSWGSNTLGPSLCHLGPRRGDGPRREAVNDTARERVQYDRNPAPGRAAPATASPSW